jgi:hypothetical protein
MKITNLSGGVLTQGWMVSGLSPRITSGYSGLSATFMLKATFKLRHGDLPVPWEKGPELISGDLPIGKNKKKGLGYASDYAPYKQCADFSIVGTAYPPSIQSKSFLAKVTVGTVSRAVGVIGERIWESGVFTDRPGPASRAKPTTLSYDNAWGGIEDKLNPLGMGRDGDKMALLEIPDSPVQDRNEAKYPALFAPMPADCPLRKSKQGTYDDEWLKNRWPWLPEDFDYSFYNAAPPSQWFPEFPVGDEELFFENMHPEIPVYKSRLPGIRARCFISRVVNWEAGLPEESKKREFREVTLKLDTIWADLDQEQLILVWRGNTPCDSIKFYDIEHLVTAMEPLDASLSEEHYKKVWESAVAPAAEITTPNEEEFFALDENSTDNSSRHEPSLEELPPRTSPPLPMPLDEIRAKGLADQDLRNLDFSGLDLSRVNFRGASLGGARFAKSKLVGADFTGADMTGVDLREADLTSAVLDQCDLSKADVSGATWGKCSLNNALLVSLKLDGSDFSGVKGVRCDFSKSSLTKSNFKGAQLIQCDFSESRLDQADFTGGKLAQSSFRRASAS